MSVDESTVIFGPIDQVGWASASSTVTSASSARRAAPERAAAGGEHDAGDPVEPSSPARRHWWTAQCSLSTGTSSAPGVRAGPLHHRARRRSATPCWPGPGAARPSSVARVTAQAGEADHAVDARRRPRRRCWPAPSAPARTSTPGGSRSSSSAAGSASATATTVGPDSSRPGPTSASTDGRWRRGRRPRKRSGSAATTSRVWVPIEPVEPARATVRHGRCRHRSAAGRRQLERGSPRCEQQVPVVRPGSTNSSASKRSSTPPWPGRIVPMSLTPRSRLTSDSHRSPSGGRRRRRPGRAGGACPSCPTGRAPRTGDARSGRRPTRQAMPPSRPSTVLFGLAGDSGVWPGAAADEQAADVVGRRWRGWRRAGSRCRAVGARSMQRGERAEDRRSR